MIFESQNSMDDALFVIRYMMNITFPLHLHHSFEYVEQICGSTEITISDQKYLLEPGDAVLIFPLQLTLILLSPKDVFEYAYFLQIS